MVFQIYFQVKSAVVELKEFQVHKITTVCQYIFCNMNSREMKTL
jgi:hypothetical protein